MTDHTVITFKLSFMFTKNEIDIRSIPKTAGTNDLRRAAVGKEAVTILLSDALISASQLPQPLATY